MPTGSLAVRQKLFLAFILSNLFSFLGAPLFPALKIFSYSPLLVLLITHTHLSFALWMAFIFGSLTDFLSTTPMGLHAVNFCLTTLLLFRQRRHFFADNPYNLSLFSALFSFNATLLYALLFFIFDRRVLLSGKWVLTDLLFLPAIDGLYAFIWFTLPFAVWEKLQKRLRIFLINRRN